MILAALEPLRSSLEIAEGSVSTQPVLKLSSNPALTILTDAAFTAGIAVTDNAAATSAVVYLSFVFNFINIPLIIIH